MSTSSFSYFSNDNVATNTTHNNISISCTSVGNGRNVSPQRTGGGGLTGDAAVIQRPTPAQKCISAIGSEIKNAQQQKQKSKEQHWSHFGTDSMPITKPDNVACSSSFVLGAVADGTTTGGGIDMTLQEKYQQSKYYNGFDVFTAGSSGGSSSSATTAAHIHHSCGDDSPPPSITGYNSYLEGIPNTGVIRYDDASFLKNLIPGQNLNTEVSIHNVSDSNFARNANSPQAHRVEITPVYGGNRPASSNSLFEPNTVQNNPSNFRGNYRDHYNDSNIFSNNNMHMNLGELDPAMKYDFESTQHPQPTTSVANVTSSDNHNSILDFNNILNNNKNGTTGSASHRTSPYMDEHTLEGFVQNINSMRISSNTTVGAAPTAAADEQSSQMNGNSSGSGIGHHTVTTSANTNGWW
ncbi:probable ATP-dependent RNA helicase ddx42 [Musca vetustissima]|uniref:probable ATP-dependent RNA helicase ddx42 n=1 Tax=Musca vetustissima TaxID=27455 RepID=UPI002AB67EB8|nr:probable ATP-dependent RNA helicase ddx42 [Musca vetustissima]